MAMAAPKDTVAELVERAVACGRQDDLPSLVRAGLSSLTALRLSRFDDGQVAYDCSLGERFVGPMTPLVIKKIITTWDAMPALERGFKSDFAKMAWADLLAYEEIKAANEANLSDLLERPYEDLVTKELIDSLPGPKIEDLEPESVPQKVKVDGYGINRPSSDGRGRRFNGTGIH